MLGGFDEHYLPAYYEDTDLAFRVRAAGKKVMYQPLSVVIHYEGISHGTDTGTGIKAHQVENQKKFYARWAEVLKSHYENAENPSARAIAPSGRRPSWSSTTMCRNPTAMRDRAACGASCANSRPWA